MISSRQLLIAAALATTAASPPGPVASPPEARSFMLGKLKLTALHDANFAALNDGKTFGVDAGAAAVAKSLSDNGLPSDRIAVSVNALLVQMPGRLIMLDTGLGPNAMGNVAASLAKAGFSPADVTDVLITHTHGDHVGGLATADGHPAFPKATVRMAAKEWAWMRSQPGSAALVKAITPQVRTFEPGTVVAPGITAVAIDGHTPGHSGYEIVSGNARLLDIGDTAHSYIVSLQHPEWAMGFDNDKITGKASRLATLARLAASHEMVFSPHFPYPGIGTIVPAGNAYRWVPSAAAGATS